MHYNHINHQLKSAAKIKNSIIIFATTSVCPAGSQLSDILAMQHTSHIYIGVWGGMKVCVIAKLSLSESKQEFLYKIF